MKVRPWRRTNRRLGAEAYFRRLYPLLGSWRVTKLAMLAVRYWEQPERFR